MQPHRLRSRRFFMVRRVITRTCAAALLLVAFGSAGCTFQEAVIDGAYGGVSDTIAAIISETLLGLRQ